MNVQSVRFGPDQWAVIQAAAQIAGVNTAQFIRDAAFGRAVAVMVAHEATRADGTETEALFKAYLAAAFANHADLREQVLTVLREERTKLRAGSRARTSRAGRGKATPPDTRRSRPRT